MTNYEKYKESIALRLQRGEELAFNKNTKEAVACQHLDCEDCLFYGCSINVMKWLVSEYKEEVDWSKVPVDTPVLVSDDGTNWVRRHFAKVTSLGTICVYSGGGTSWTVDTNPILPYKYAKLAEVEYDTKSEES